MDSHTGQDVETEDFPHEMHSGHPWLHTVGQKEK